MDAGRREGPHIKIVEQPASKALRFRYECEGRSAGSIPGINSTPENKTYPTIQIVGYQGRAVVVVSCVTKDHPYRPHPHNLVGRDGCKKGVCTVEVNNENMTQSFDHLGIQCVKKKDIEEALKAREDIRVDPFRTGFSHRTQAGSIDLNAVRLCFQAFLEDEPGKFKLALIPVISDIIYDKKALCDLAICKLSHCSAPVAGGLEMILLCEKVAKEDISVRLYEERNGQVVWEGLGDFSPTQVHKQVAITFKTPRYKTIQVESPVQVFIQLKRPSDGETSDSLPFKLTPLDSGGEQLLRKKPKVTHEVLVQDKDSMRVVGSQASPGLTVKREPAEGSPNPYQVYSALSPITYRASSPLDYNPVSPSYQGIVYASTSVAYPSRTVTTTSLAALSPPLTTLTSPLTSLPVSPPLGTMSTLVTLSPAQVTPCSPLAQATVGSVSPHPVYTLPGTPGLYVHDANQIGLENLPNGANYLDISSSGTFPIRCDVMENITINSKDFTEYMNVSLEEGNLSENLSNNLNLNSNPNQAKKPENMTDSFTRLANSVLNEFDG